MNIINGIYSCVLLLIPFYRNPNLGKSEAAEVNWFTFRGYKSAFLNPFFSVGVSS